MAQAEWVAESMVDDLFIEFDRINACPDGLAWCHKYDGKTFDEFIRATLTDPEYKEEWGKWFVLQFSDKIEETYRKILLSQLKSESESFWMFVNSPWLTKDEIKILEDKFKGKVPKLEERFADGRIKRKE